MGARDKTAEVLMTSVGWFNVNSLARPGAGRHRPAGDDGCGQDGPLGQQPLHRRSGTVQIG